MLRLSAHLTHQLPFCYSFTYSKERRELARKETYNTPQHILLTAFLHLASEEQFIEDEIGLLEIKYNVQLAHVTVVFVHLFHVAVHNLQRDELVVVRVYPRNEEQRRIAAVYNFTICTKFVSPSPFLVLSTLSPLYSMKLHIRVRRLSTN